MGDKLEKFETPDQIVYVCTGSKCSKRGGKDCYKSLDKLSGKGKNSFEVIRIECTDRCKFAPVLNFQPQNVWLKEYREKEVINLLEKYIK